MSVVGCEQPVLPNFYAGSRQQIPRSACVPLRVRRLERRSTCVTSNAILNAEVAAPSAPENLIAWLQGHDPISRTHSVTVDSCASDMGRRLKAVRDVPADSPLLSVPLSSVFSDVEKDEDTYLPWSARMAMRLLQQRMLCQQEAVKHKGLLCPWITALPRQVTLPHIHFTMSEIEALQDPEAVQEALAMKDAHEACFEELEQDLADIGCSKQDFDWAASVLHSRCFVEGPAAVHMSVPGVDMANHSHNPNATVKIVHSPGACQGAAASEEVCESSASEAPYFQLLAGSQGIRGGEEVTISYGAWPNDVFLLFFGFLPDQNEHDAVVLFHGLPDLIACYNRMLQQNHVAGSETSHLQSNSEQHNATQLGAGQQLAEHTHAELQPMHAQTDRSSAASSHAQHTNSNSVSVQSPASDSATNAESSFASASLGMRLLDSSNTPLQHSSNPSQHDSAATGSSRQSPESVAAEANQEYQAVNMQYQTSEPQGMHQVRDGCDQTHPWTVEEQHAALLQNLGPGNWSRLMITTMGYDGRLVHAVQHLLQLDAPATRHKFTPGSVISFRCKEVIAMYSTSEQKDQVELATVKDDCNLQLAIKYRLGKKTILRQAYDAALQM